MIRHAPSSSRASARQFIGRYARWLVLAALLVAAAFTAYHITPASAAATPAASGAQASALDATMQSVLAYLRMHSGEQRSDARRALRPGSAERDAVRACA